YTSDQGSAATLLASLLSPSPLLSFLLLPLFPFLSSPFFPPPLSFFFLFPPSLSSLLLLSSPSSVLFFFFLPSLLSPLFSPLSA
ncbi:hypothetical protein ACXWRW_10870, partial [Streptococcus pyogenes]